MSVWNVSQSTLGVRSGTTDKKLGQGKLDLVIEVNLKSVKIEGAMQQSYARNVLGGMMRVWSDKIDERRGQFQLSLVVEATEYGVIKQAVW